MATPNYEQIQSFGRVSDQIRQAAIDEFMERIDESMTLDEIIEQATEVAYKFSAMGAELGAQWYDLCTELAGIDAEPAYVGELDDEGIRKRAEVAAKKGGDVRSVFDSFLQAEINAAIRKTGSANLWRDYERGLAPGKWARVPTSDACAWCLILASQGAWYLSEESATRTKSGSKFHDHCKCIAVYHASAEDIGGYSKLKQYKRMYYDADNDRIANDNGKQKYPKELAWRVKRAKEEHEAEQKRRKEEAEALGEKFTPVPWQSANETAIVMRYKHPGMH